MSIEHAYPTPMEPINEIEDPQVSSLSDEESDDLFTPETPPLHVEDIRDEELSARRGNHFSRRKKPSRNNSSRVTGEVLGGKDAYNLAITREMPSDSEVWQFVADAREGCKEARGNLVEYVTKRAWSRALRLSAYYKALRDVELDPQDIAQEAALRCLKRLDKALAHPNPVGYLYLAIEGAMLTFCRERQSAVRVPAPMQSRGQRPVYVVSLNAPLSPHSRRTLADTLPTESFQV
jgi:DNA-directed RNA polymerase specialized sigma24 family protein